LLAVTNHHFPWAPTMTGLAIDIVRCLFRARWEIAKVYSVLDCDKDNR